MGSRPHLSASVLERLLAGRLPAEEEDALRDHLAEGSCPTCAAGLADVDGPLVRRAVRMLLARGLDRAARPIDAAAEGAQLDAILQRMRYEGETRRRRRRVLVLAAGVAALLPVGLWLAAEREAPPGSVPARADAPPTIDPRPSDADEAPSTDDLVRSKGGPLPGGDSRLRELVIVAEQPDRSWRPLPDGDGVPSGTVVLVRVHARGSVPVVPVVDYGGSCDVLVDDPTRGVPTRAGFHWLDAGGSLFALRLGPELGPQTLYLLPAPTPAGLCVGAETPSSLGLVGPTARVVVTQPGQEDRP